MSFFDAFCYCLTKKKWFIIPFVVGLLCFGLAWLCSPVYETEIRLQVESSNENMMQPSMLSSSFKSGLSSLGGSSLSNFLSTKTGVKPSDLYVEILSGREVALEAIHEFRLDTLYKKKRNELLLKKFYKDFKVEEEDTGIISCSFEGKNRVLAVELLRFMVESANTRYLNLERERLLNSLEYMEKTKKDLMDSVKAVSTELSKFYRKNNLVDLEEQMAITLKALSGYESQINNYKLTEQAQGKNNAEATEIRKRRKILEDKFKELRGQYKKNYVPSDNSMYVNSDWAVSKLMYQEKRQSDLKMYMSLLEIANVEAMMTEAQQIKQMPAIQIIQDAYIPDWKVRPKRATWALTGFALSFVLTLLCVVFQGLSAEAIPNTFGFGEKIRLLKKSLRK